MNFLDEVEWADLDKLEKDHLELTERSLALLHERLKPYFLRRLKIDVLDLPPKVSSFHFQPRNMPNKLASIE
jgi:chromodomain-helicase-DNA-binding protein 4